MSSKMVNGIKKLLKSITWVLLALLTLSPNVAAITTSDIQSIIEQHPYYDPGASAVACSASTTGSVYFIGDSIGTQVQDSLSKDFGSGFKANALGSRNLSGTPPSPDGLGTIDIDQDQAFIKTAGSVVIELGTNTGGFTSANIGQMISKVKILAPSAKIYWVDTAVVVRQDYAQTLSQINSTIYSEASKNNFQVIPWNKKVFGPSADPAKIDPNAPDNGYIRHADEYVHLTDSGITAMSGLITTTVGGSSGGSSCCSSNSIGSDDNEKAFNFLISSPRDLSKEDASAIVGNFIVESGKDPIDPTGENPGTHAYGIGQWYSGRLTGLQNYASKPGNSLTSLDTQLNYLWDIDLPSQEPGFHVLEKLKQAATLDEKAVSWEDTFERSGGKLIPQRITATHKIFTQFGSNTGGSTSSDSTICAPDPSGERVGNYSLPVDKHFYDENKIWFTKDHHMNGNTPDIAADIPVPENTPVYSMSAGKVLYAPVGGGCGLGVQVDAGDGVNFVYCHGSDGGSVSGAKVGDQVKPGQLIMNSDNTGSSTGPHLHVGIIINGVFHCPQTFFVGIAAGSPPDVKSLPASGCSSGQI